MIWLPAIYTFTPPFDVATLANPKTPQRSPEWRYGLVSKTATNTCTEIAEVNEYTCRYICNNTSTATVINEKPCHWNHKHWWHLTQMRNPPQKITWNRNLMHWWYLTQIKSTPGNSPKSHALIRRPSWENPKRPSILSEKSQSNALQPPKANNCTYQ